jgi:hypothetical protein
MKLLLALVITLGVVGCSSAPRQTARPYCHTSQEIRTTDNTVVSSETVVKCNDDPVENIVMKRAGIASNCGESTNWITLPNGKSIETKQLVCQKFNGRWEVIPEYISR